MLPDFPLAKAKAERQLEAVLDPTQDPFLAQVPRVHLHEGDKTLLKALGQSQRRRARGFTKYSAPISLPVDQLEGMPLQEVIARIAERIEEVHGEVVKSMLDTLGGAAETVGNRVDLRGQPLSQEVYLDLLSRLPMDFDPQGRPVLPTLVASPETAHNIREALAQWATDLEFRRRFIDLVERKRVEWRDRENNRQLVG